MKEVIVKGLTKHGWYAAGYYIPLKSKTYILPYAISIKSDDITINNLIEVKPDTVCEYTWLNDINGDRIYNGDILESRASNNMEDWKLWQVVYSDGRYVITRDHVYRKKPKHEEEILCEDNIKLYGLTLTAGNIHAPEDMLNALKIKTGLNNDN